MLRVIYRSFGSENRKARPPYYDKRLCLASFLESLLAAGGEPEIVYLNDGPIPGDRLELMGATGDVVELPPPHAAAIREIIRSGKGGSGPARSYLAALALVDERGWPDQDLVYLAEDDYLYRREAFGALLAAADAIPHASYYSLYATIDPPRCHTFFAHDRPWATAVSSTSTYGARAGALRADRWIHRIAWFVDQPIDQRICRAYQGLRPFTWSKIFGDLLGADHGIQTGRDRLRAAALQLTLNGLAIQSGFRPHALVTPFTPLATHVELPFIAAGTDWEAIAQDAAAWLSRRAAGLPGSPI